MLLRLGIALLIVATGVGVYYATVCAQRRTLTNNETLTLIGDRFRPGVPAIVYFWSEACAPCQTIQTPTLNQLIDEIGIDGVQIVKINALDESQIAEAWCVLSLPTTFVLDASGEMRHVNHGVARLDKLKRQIMPLLPETGHHNRQLSEA